MYGLEQFHHRQNKAEKRGDLAKKKQQLLSKHRAAADGKNSQKTAVAHWSHALKHAAGRSAAS